MTKPRPTNDAGRDINIEHQGDVYYGVPSPQTISRMAKWADGRRIVVVESPPQWVGRGSYGAPGSEYVQGLSYSKALEALTNRMAEHFRVDPYYARDVARAVVASLPSARYLQLTVPEQIRFWQTAWRQLNECLESLD